MNTITIDCGASFIKGALFENGIITRQSQKKTPAIEMVQTILNPVQITAILATVRQMIANLVEDKSEVCLCVSNEMHGFILCYENGEPFTDYISWQKEYGDEEINGVSSLQILSGNEYKDDVVHTGMPLRAGLPSCNLLYLVRKGILNTTKQKLYFYTLGDYVVKMLSGQEPVCHPTNAAASGLLDLRTGDWNPVLINLVGADKVIFPVIGTKKIIFRMNDIKVHAWPAIGDQQAALLGAGLKNVGELSFNLGTGAQVSKLVREPEWSESYQIRPFFKQMYLKTIPHLPSGRALNVFIRFFQDVFNQFQIEMSEDTIWQQLLIAEKECEKTGIKCDMSFFGNPLSKSTVGSITNIEEYGFNVGALMKGIFLQMVKNFLWAADIIEPQSNCIQHIIFSGGVARKIESIREEIIAYYNDDVKVTIASNETMLGLYLYGNQRGLI